NMYIMDQHAAHERINYEKFLYQYNHQNIVIQNLLIPETIHLSMVEYEKAISSITIFKMLGFDISDFGFKTILVNALPALFTDGNIKHMFYEILDNLDTHQQQDFSMLKIDALIKRACTASIKGGDKMTLKEVEFLLKSLSKCESPYSCPHGRPIWIKFSQYDLEKYFNRIN
ncbi:MAG: DNA mismatch repair protein MutL, partial [Tissierellales bacterium]|nr:DNA mismatch repair protein MutL [Tissierellales bacterium]